MLRLLRDLRILLRIRRLGYCPGCWSRVRGARLYCGGCSDE